MHQFHAGYILDIIAEKISSFERNKDKYDSNVLKMKGLLKHVSAFDVEFPSHITKQKDYNNYNPVIATINNIITRGLPTRAPILIEEEISKILNVTTKDTSKQSSINYIEKDYTISWDTIFELFHIVEPNLDIHRKNYLGNLGSEEKGEWGFIHTQLKDKPFVKQIFQSQRCFATIDKKLGAGRSVDFSFEFPYLYKEIKYDDMGHGKTKEYVVLNSKGVIFEYDGKTHKGFAYKKYDEYRDDVAADAGFDTIRQSSDIRELSDEIVTALKNEVFNIFEKNFRCSIFDLNIEYILLFTPLAVARIQKTLIEVFLSNPEYLEKSVLNIAIIERDVPCGTLAVNSLIEHIKNLNGLLEDNSKLKFPEVNLTIIPDERFIRYNFNQECKIASDIVESEFDLILDHSILRRSGVYKEDTLRFSSSILIRSSHFIDKSFGSLRRTYCAIPLKYKTLGDKQPNGKYIAKEIAVNLNFFIRNIFRKPSFRDGQLPIIDRALRHLPVIGLLPTGGGKSLTYQLPALLQPGLTIIVDPIKSLMEDQVRVLNENWIDCCDYINSTLSRSPKLSKLTDFRFGESQMLFLSPERFVMEDFRQLVQNINTFFGLAISYCVIDEAHCVSEWGHDFRDTYLHLGRNAQEFCYSKNANKVSLIALTATASFDVLADIERELQIEHADVANAIVAIENTIRPEQFFRVVTCEQEDKISTLQNDFNVIGKNLQYWNDLDILKKSIEYHKNNFDPDCNISSDKMMLQTDKKLSNLAKEKFPAIIFCATKSNLDDPIKNSVCYVHNYLQSDSKGYYFGGIDDDTVAEDAQKSFEKFVKGDLSHIVCTKAFGMGIDKEDVRTVYHVNYSSSLESYVQEAGRAGRDQKIAEAVVILNNKEIFKINPEIVFTRKVYEVNDFLRNKDYRNKIRWDFVKKLEGNNKNDLCDLIDKTNIPQPDIDTQKKIKEFLKSNIITTNPDRNQQEYFFNLNYKGEYREKVQIHNLFYRKELEDVVFKDKLNNTEDENTFEYIIPNELDFSADKLVGVLNPYIDIASDSNKKKFLGAYEYSHNYFDLLLQLEEKNILTVPLLSINNINFLNDLKYTYHNQRGNHETGKIIYRMNCIGFLEDYRLDFVKKQRICRFYKSKDIRYYVGCIKEYLLRYLSETSANKEIIELEARLDRKEFFASKIIECLYYLTEFSYKEIKGKRERAIKDIERVFQQALSKEDVYEQNIVIKEEIFYYFNAKYARKDYKIDGKLFSLLLDSNEGKLSAWWIVEKYTIKLKDSGIKINNLKHLIGSCRKITRSMSPKELEKEWSLKLIKAFAEYSMNIESYIKEANKNLLEGFTIFYKMECNNDFRLFKEKFNEYFDILEENLDKSNNLFKNELNLIMHSIMLQVNNERTEELIQKHNNLKQKYNA